MKINLKLEKFNNRKLGWLHDALKFIAIFVFIFVMFRFVIGFSVVDGLSMYPTLKNGEFVVYLRTVRNYKTGDIVCVWVPSGNYYVKRVVASGEDSITIVDGTLYVNGEAENEDYVYGVTEEENGAVIYPYVISEDNYFVLGDNREVSNDSRAFGEVSSLQIKGKIIFGFGGDKE